MPSLEQKKGLTGMDIKIIIGVIIIYGFGIVVPPIEPITEMGMRVLGVLIGLMYMTCVGCPILLSSLLGLIAFVFHGYYNVATLLSKWTGSTTVFQLVFAGALCLGLKETGAMDVLSKKMLTSKMVKGRPVVLLLMLLIVGFMVSIFMGGAPYFLLFYGIIDSIVGVAGYDKDDDFIKMALLGIYVGQYGMFLIPWKGAMASTVAVFNSVLAPYGFEFNALQYIIIQIVTFVGFDVVYVLALKFLFKVDLDKLAKVDVSTMEEFAKIPDKFDKRMKVALGCLLFCIVYAILVSFGTNLPGYSKWGFLTITFAWCVPLLLFSVVRVDGRPLFNVAKLTTESSAWTMIALVGAMTILGNVCVDTEIGIRAWIASKLEPLFTDMPAVLLFALVIFSVVAITQFVHGMVLTMAVSAVVAPIFCTRAIAGEAANPTVICTVLSQCAQIAFLTVSGSVSAAYLLNRKEITQKFLWTKGIAVIGLFMVWQFIVAVVCNLLMPATQTLL